VRNQLGWPAEHLIRIGILDAEVVSNFQLLIIGAHQHPGWRRLTAYKLAIRGSRMPGAVDGFSLGPDSVNFRRRLRQAHPETEAAMKKQREACEQACLASTRSDVVEEERAL